MLHHPLKSKYAVHPPLLAQIPGTCDVTKPNKSKQQVRVKSSVHIALFCPCLQVCACVCVRPMKFFYNTPVLWHKCSACTHTLDLIVKRNVCRRRGTKRRENRYKSGHPPNIITVILFVLSQTQILVADRIVR